MTRELAERTPFIVAAVTTVAGLALTAAPDKPAELLKTDDTLALRVIGVADLALVPGLIAGKPKWPWMAARVALNAAIAAYVINKAREVGAGSWRLKAVAGALAGVSVMDVQAARVLHAEGL